MARPEEIEQWRGVLARLLRGTAPEGEEFELCREVVAVAPDTPEGRQAARRLLEGAMADAATNIADAQAVMDILKAADRGAVDLAQLTGAR